MVTYHKNWSSLGHFHYYDLAVLANAIDDDVVLYAAPFEIYKNAMGDRLFPKRRRNKWIRYDFRLSPNMEDVMSLCNGLSKSVFLTKLDLHSYVLGGEMLISLCEALERNISLEHLALHLRDSGGVSHIGNALTRNTTLIRLDLSLRANAFDSYRADDLLPALERNNTLLKLTLTGSLTREAHLKLVEGLSHNTISLTHFVYDHHEFIRKDFWTTDSLLILDTLRTNTNLQKLYFHPYDTPYQTLLESVRGALLKNTTLTSLYTMSFTDQTLANYLPLERAIKLNTSLQRLSLHVKQERDISYLHMEDLLYVNIVPESRRRKRDSLVRWSGVKRMLLDLNST
jgi:hypothetical protein